MKIVCEIRTGKNYVNNGKQLLLHCMDLVYRIPEVFADFLISQYYENNFRPFLATIGPKILRLDLPALLNKRVNLGGKMPF